LHPKYFQPNRAVAVRNGLLEVGNTFLVRLVSWNANHDVSESGWDLDLLTRLVSKLGGLGKVLISSERALPPNFEDLRYRGDPAQIHHVLAHCRAYIGESATMASEAAVLGVPALLVATTGRGYTDEQEKRYGLVTNVPKLKWDRLEPALEKTMDKPAAHWAKARRRLLEESVDVAAFVADCITDFPRKLASYKAKASA
jgi:predicted glycosyltransferase